MAARATGKSGDPIIIEDNMEGDSKDNSIEIKEDTLDFMNNWTAEPMCPILVLQEKSPLNGPKRDHFFSKEGPERDQFCSKEGPYYCKA